ncbi:MAG: transglycosylase SLT domain-containing protein [Candidatus Woesearchaeota archaeon]
MASLTRYAVLRRAVPYAVAAAIGVCACAKVHQRPLEFILSKIEQDTQVPEEEKWIQNSFYAHNACYNTHEGLPDHLYAETCSTHMIIPDQVQEINPQDALHPQVQKMYIKYKEGGKYAELMDRKILRSKKYTFFLEGAAERYDIPVELLRAQMIHESNMDEDAKSHVGALGLMQIMPHTAKEMNKGCLEHITDPATSIYCGARYMGQMLRQFNGNETMALAAYNWGPHKVKRGLARLGIKDPADFHMLDYSGLPKETRGYITRIMATKKVIQDKKKTITRKENMPENRTEYASARRSDTKL